MEISIAFTEWVRAPMEMMSTPVSATARRVSSVMPPLASSRARAIHQPHRLRHGRAIHVVHHDHIGPRLQRLPHLLQIPGFHLQLHHMPHAYPGWRPPPGDPSGGVDMIVLEHGPVGQVKAMIFPPPTVTAYFCSARSPGRVFRVSVMEAGVPSTSFTARRGGGGHPGHMLQQVQRGALPFEQEPGAPFQLGDDVSRASPRCPREDAPGR